MNDNVLILGGIIIDNYIQVEKFPVIGQDVTITNSFERVGGCSINVAMTLKNLGISSQVVSTVGRDMRGKSIVEYLTNKNLNKCFLEIVEDYDTGYCHIVLSGEGERTFMTYKGSESVLTDEMFERILSDVSNSYIYLTGYYLSDELHREKKIELLESLKSQGCKVIFDPGSLVDEIDKENLLRLLRISDVFIPNLGEMEKISEVINSIKDINEWMYQEGCSLIVLKNGGDEFKAFYDNSYHDFMPYKVKVMDTTGAGDSFAAGLIYGLINKFDKKRTIELASACGALATTVLDPHCEFTVEDVENLVNK